MYMRPKIDPTNAQSKKEGRKRIFFAKIYRRRGWKEGRKNKVYLFFSLFLIMWHLYRIFFL